MNAAIIKVGKVSGQVLYRVLQYTGFTDEAIERNKDGRFGVAICKEATSRVNILQKTADQIKMDINGGLGYVNAELVNGELKGKFASLSRFTNEYYQYIILAELVDAVDGRTIGYVLAKSDGTVSRMQTATFIGKCREIYTTYSTDGNVAIPVQNAQFVIGGKSKDYVKPYQVGQWPRIKIKSNPGKSLHPVTANPNLAYGQNVADAVLENKKDDTAKKAEYRARIMAAFTAEQINEIKLGKRNSKVDIRVYANPKFKAEQMRALRLLMSAGIDVRKFARPEYSEEQINQIGGLIMLGMDISPYIRPEYSVGQLSSLATGLSHGVDISQYADPKLTPIQMERKRIELENELWISNLNESGN